MLKELNHLIETANKKYKADRLSYSESALDPVINPENVKVHYEIHTIGYARKANEKGDQFNINGINLHNIWWKTLQSPMEDNASFDEDKFIKFVKKANTFTEFVKMWEEAANSIEGNGWVILDKSGNINIVSNHDWNNPDDIVMLLDCWEHAYYLTYPGRKAKFVTEMWKCYNWNVIEARVA